MVGIRDPAAYLRKDRKPWRLEIEGKRGRRVVPVLLFEHGKIN
jgi:hypothetical protein